MKIVNRISKIIKVLLLWQIIILLPSCVVCQTQSLSNDSLTKSILKSIDYLTIAQTQETIIGKQYAGEWEAYMSMKMPFVMLGGKSKYRDSNCFTMAGIHNILAEMYLQDTTRKQILLLLKSVFPEVMSYGSIHENLGWEFNFWKALPPNRDLRKRGNPTGVLVRRPTNFILKNRFINNAANVENDADDTSMGNLAIWYQQQIFGNKEIPTIIKPSVFDNWIDSGRENRNWYNHLFHGFANSGAYLTWLSQEKEYDSWSFGKTFFQNLIFYLPKTVCYPTPFKPYIPWGSNDVDAVVNANVLTYLAKTNQFSISTKNANLFIQKHAKRGRWNKTTVYYPNRYHFHYAVSRALASGDDGLKITAKYLIDDLKKTQQKDGSFESVRRINKRDKVQSTAYALSAMLYLKEAGFDISKESIEKSILYLEANKQNQNSWKGGVFFSGGTIVRGMLYFTSDAYTTALITLCYSKYLQLY